MENLILKAKDLDFNDSLKKYRDEFHFPESKTYLCGHSLGLQPKRTQEWINQTLKDWQEKAIEGFWSEKRAWISYTDSIKESLSKLVGADSSEIVVMNSLSVNLHLLLSDFYQPTSDRKLILIEEKAFPSDQYACHSQILAKRFDPNECLIRVPQDQWESSIHKYKEKIALVLVGHPNYLSSRAFDIPAIKKLSQEYEFLMGLDLAHGIGNLEILLNEWDVDFAVWCHYKFLNSGPGSVGGAYINKKHFSKSRKTRLEGWWGNSRDTRFEMRDQIDADPTADAWQISTPNILSMTALKASLSIFDEVGIEAIIEKREKLTGFLIEGLEKISDSNFTIVTPKDASMRGATISLEFKSDAQQIGAKLKEKNMIVDFRKPNLIRVAPIALYNSFEDIVKFLETIQEISRN